jgi:hypothetical protein
MDKRIGKYNPDGTRDLPELTISGNRVFPPIAGDIRLDATHFIVLDALPTVDVGAELATLRAGLPGVALVGSLPPAATVEANVDDAPPTDNPRRRG